MPPSPSRLQTAFLGTFAHREICSWRDATAQPLPNAGSEPRRLPEQKSEAQGMANKKDTEAEQPRMKRRDYEPELARLQGELVAMQEWVRSSGAKICIVFEGRDTAGKGGTIKRITERVSPRVFRVIALPAPSPREQPPMSIQPSSPHFPAGRAVVISDPSWYHREGVERLTASC